MNPFEKKAVGALAAIFGMRMLGLFLLLPVLAVYAAQLPGSTPLTVGLSLGIYGLTQGLLQIPFGLASDRFGRKGVITLGLVVFAAGGAVAALADSVTGLIAGRALQGAGAVSAALLALTADLTREEQRTTAMALVGLSIGGAFMISLMAAAPLAAAMGVPGLFWLTVALAALAIALLWLTVPNARRISTAGAGSPLQQLRRVLRNAQLVRLGSGAFVLHMTLTAMFVALPPLLTDAVGLALAEHWKLYVPLLLLSVGGMLPLIRLAKRRPGRALATAIGGLLVACTAMAWVSGIATLPTLTALAALFAALWLYFATFNALEGMLPSLVSRLAPSDAKGAAMGVHNGFQFLGMFAGGAGGGWASGQYGAAGVYWLCAGGAALWWLIALSAPRFRLSASHMIPLGRMSEYSDSQRAALLATIRNFKGVQEVTLIRGETVAHLKVDESRFNRTAFDQLIRNST